MTAKFDHLFCAIKITLARNTVSCRLKFAPILKSNDPDKQNPDARTDAHMQKHRTKKGDGYIVYPARCKRTRQVQS